MQRRYRVPVLVLLLLLGVVVGGGVAAWRWTERPLEPPEKADREELIRWLVTRDLALQPGQTRRALARRLEEEFQGDVDWDAAGRKLNVSQRRQLWANVPWLLEPWLLDKVEGYFGVPDRQRPAYVDRVIDTIVSWRGVEVLRPEGLDQEQPTALMAVLSQRFDVLRGRSDADRRRQMDQFLFAVQSQWLLRTFGGSASGER